MDASIKKGTTEHQLDLEFRMGVVGGNIKKAMNEGTGKGNKFTAGDLWNVKPKVIEVIPGYNVRERNAKYYAEVDALKKSMIAIGFKKDSPLSVIIVDEGDGKYSIKLKRGHKRLEAVLGAIAEGAPIATVPCIVASDDVSEEDLTADLINSNNGSPLTPYGVAVVCKRMTRFHPDDHATIAEKLGMWSSQVTDHLMFINSPIEIINYVREERVSFTTAVEILKKHGVKALTVIEQGLARSVASGSKTGKLMPRFIPGKVIKKAVTKAGPEMKTAIESIRKDEGFQKLSPENQQKLEEILQQFREAEEQENKLNEENPPAEQKLDLDSAEA